MADAYVSKCTVHACVSMVRVVSHTVTDAKVERNVYLIGNPLVIWITSFAIILWMVVGAVYLHMRGTYTISQRIKRALQLCRCVFYVCVCRYVMCMDNKRM